MSLTHKLAGLSFLTGFTALCMFGYLVSWAAAACLVFMFLANAIYSAAVISKYLAELTDELAEETRKELDT